MQNNPSPTNTYRRISLFSPYITLFLTLFLCLLGCFFWYIAQVTEGAEKEYQKLISEAESSRSSSANEKSYTARQERFNVQKDLFFYKNQQRLHIHLKAAEAQLILDHKDAHNYLVENLQNVKCYMQEELYYLLQDGREASMGNNGMLLLKSADPKNSNSWIPIDTPGLKPMQVVRLIEAKEALYYYKDDRFVAHSVNITRYSSPGHILKEDKVNTHLLMKGTAGQVEFSLKGKNQDLNFQAHQLKSTFFDLGGVHL